ncbi:MAG: hypothetical protein COB51_13485 [Moraxellaceae bacterium]|nr:MAG: hypothetical protein COB51_13485 [Moraxellaceae bacterium]
MEDRPYFIVGDLIANLSVGILSAIACAALFGTGSNMFFAMIVGMLVGMVLAMVLGAALFFRYFGAMEVMIPTSLTGMIAGMIVSMWATMGAVSTSGAIFLGALSAALSLIITYRLQAKISGIQEGV